MLMEKGCLGYARCHASPVEMWGNSFNSAGETSQSGACFFQTRISEAVTFLKIKCRDAHSAIMTHVILYTTTISLLYSSEQIRQV